MRHKLSRLLAAAAVSALVAVPLAPATAVEYAGEVTPASATPVADGPAKEAATQAADQVLTFTASASVSAYASAPATAAAGPTTIVFENSTATGNNIGMSHTLTFETGSSEYNQDVTLDILANPLDANGGRYEAEVNLTPGTYRYFCAIPGHGTMSGELVVTEGGGGDDTTAPTVTAEVQGDQNDEGAYVGAATVNLAADDGDGSGVESVEYDLDGAGYTPYTAPVVLDEPGTYMLEYRATDVAGNTSEPEMLHVTVVAPDGEDTTPPVVTAEVTGDLDGDGAYVGSASVNLTARDPGSGVAGIEYDLDGAGYAAYTAPVVVDEPGEHTVTYRATDRAGNVSEPGSATFTVVEAPPEDTAPPTVTAQVTGEQDEDGAYVGSATVQVLAEDTGSGVESVEYSLDGAAYAPYTDAIVVDVTGAHTVSYRATDAAGNTSEPGTVDLVVVGGQDPPDTTQPIASAQVDGDQDDEGFYLGSATVTITARDDESGVAFIEYALDSPAFREYTGAVEVTEPGSHAFAYRATDNAGNVTRTGTLRFDVARGEIDACPVSDERPTVIIGNKDSRVTNYDTGNGCTVADLIDADGGWVSHSAFVSHVTQVTDQLDDADVITAQEATKLIRAARQSDVGR
ncbi:OmpL47-type beta-barrel domain-containing protein [Promicromonospora kroppenstedtii]|uniref:OmpL47-type beta-barrel domain-containing protein n=1 Tax=Promicromonospora kroppenstedtii TaxID=440482 RepID=UPI0004BC1DB4|nr:plastocyanin/azurin family copper-binding protein [Promicromonospora kroppenstedtii]